MRVGVLAGVSCIRFAGPELERAVGREAGTTVVGVWTGKLDTSGLSADEAEAGGALEGNMAQLLLPISSSPITQPNPRNATA
jgi:hypothetical protein